MGRRALAGRRGRIGIKPGIELLLFGSLIGVKCIPGHLCKGLFASLAAHPIDINRQPYWILDRVYIKYSEAPL